MPKEPKRTLESKLTAAANKVRARELAKLRKQRDKQHAKALEEMAKLAALDGQIEELEAAIEKGAV